MVVALPVSYTSSLYRHYSYQLPIPTSQLPAPLTDIIARFQCLLPTSQLGFRSPYRHYSQIPATLTDTTPRFQLPALTSRLGSSSLTDIMARFPLPLPTEDEHLSVTFRGCDEWTTGDRPAIAERKTLIITSCVGIFLPEIITALNPASLSKAIDWWDAPW